MEGPSQDRERGDGGGRDCLSLLGERRDDVRRALHGRPLQVLIQRTDDPRTARLLLTAQGHVLDLPDDQEFHPDAEIRGTGERILAFLTGTIPLFDAMVSRLLTLHVSLDVVRSYDDLRRLVAELLAGEDS